MNSIRTKSSDPSYCMCATAGLPSSAGHGCRITAGQASSGTRRSLFQPAVRAETVLFAILILAASFCAAPDVHAQSSSDSRLPQRKSFVPIADLDVVLTGDREGVLLSRDEFQALYTKAQANEAAAPRLPAGIVVSDADY